MEKTIVLLVGYVEPTNGDVPSLVISEQMPKQLVYRKVVTGTAATKLYKELTEKE